MTNKPKGLPPTKTCNAWLPSKEDYCKKTAGWHTTHPGYGRCMRHGGNLNPNSNLVLPAPEKLQALAEKYYADSDVFDLRKEIAVAKAAIANIEIDEDDPNLSIPSINMLLNTIGKLVQTLHEIEVGRKYVIRVSDVHGILEKVLMLMMEYIPDAETRRILAGRMKAELSVPGMVELPPAEWRYTSEYFDARSDKEIEDKLPKDSPVVKGPVEHYLDQGLKDTTPK